MVIIGILLLRLEAKVVVINCLCRAIGINAAMLCISLQTRLLLLVHFSCDFVSSNYIAMWRKWKSCRPSSLTKLSSLHLHEWLRQGIHGCGLIREELINSSGLIGNSLCSRHHGPKGAMWQEKVVTLIWDTCLDPHPHCPSLQGNTSLITQQHVYMHNKRHVGLFGAWTHNKRHICLFGALRRVSRSMQETLEYVCISSRGSSRTCSQVNCTKHCKICVF